MAYTTTIYPQTVTWSTYTWDNGITNTGGLLTCVITHASQDIQDRTGSSEYPTFVGMVNKSLTVRVTLRELKHTDGLGGVSGNLVLTAKSSNATTVTVTCATMRLRDVEMTQNRAEPAQAVLTFVHESADGTTVPVS